MDNKLIKKINFLLLSFIIFMCIIFPIGTPIMAGEGVKPYEVSGFSDGTTKEASTLKEAFELVNGRVEDRSYTITLLSDSVEETEPAILKARKILLKSKDGSKFTIKNSKTRHIISKGGESDLTLSNIILDGGKMAGGIECIENFTGKFDDLNRLKISKSQINNCKVEKKRDYDNLGGAIEFKYYGQLIVEDSSFSGNEAEYGGGAIYLSNDRYEVNNKILIKNSLFTGNRSGFGGAINIESNKAEITDSKFTNNYVKYNGGAIFIDNVENAALKALKITNNISDFWGGGIGIGLGNISLDDVEIDNNRAHDGGGIMLENDPNLDMKSVYIRENHANEAGGGIFGAGGTFSMDKVYIYDNTVGGMRSIEGYQYMQSGQGGGICMSGTVMNLSNCFIGLNKAIGEDKGDTGSASDILFNGYPEFDLKLPSIDTLNRLNPKAKNIRFISWNKDERDNRWSPTNPTPSVGLVHSGTIINLVAAYEEIDNVVEPNKPTDAEVIGGDDRIDTTNKLSGKFYSYADKAVVARKDNFPDALTASVLAKALNAPILLTDTSQLDKRSGEELKRLGVKEAVIVGKEMAISETTEQEIKKLTGKTLRIGGLDRYETASLVAEKVVSLVGKKAKAIVATGEGFADSLSISPYAAQMGYPILLVKHDKVPGATKKCLMDLGIKEVYIMGGDSAVSNKLNKDLPKVIERIGGADRYETSAKVADNFFTNADKAFLASGQVFADALVTGPVAAKENGPLLLTKKDKLPPAIKANIKRARYSKIFVIGLENAVSKAVIEEIK